MEKGVSDRLSRSLSGCCYCSLCSTALPDDSLSSITCINTHPAAWLHSYFKRHVCLCMHMYVSMWVCTCVWDPDWPIWLKDCEEGSSSSRAGGNKMRTVQQLIYSSVCVLSQRENSVCAHNYCLCLRLAQVHLCALMQMWMWFVWSLGDIYEKFYRAHILKGIIEMFELLSKYFRAF